MRINQNIGALNAYRNLSQTNNAQQKSLEKLSSGFRINRAADDAAGLAVSEGLRSQIGGLKVAVRNAQDGISVVQTAEGALTEVHSLLQRVRDLAVQASNTGANSAEAREAAAAEVAQALDEIDRIGNATTFGGRQLLDGSASSLSFHVGSDAGADNRVTVAIGDMRSAALDLGETAAVPATAHIATGSVTTANTRLDYTAGNLGANQEFTVTLGDGTAQTVVLDGTYADANAKLTDINSQLTGVVADYNGGALRFTAASGEEVTVGGTHVANEVGTLTVDQQGVEAQAAIDGVVALVTSGNDAAITRIDAAIADVSSQRAELGASQNRLEHTIANLNVTAENLASSESRIRDTDMAQEMVAFTRHQILAQAGTAMLAQANQAPQSILSLLR